ncbi:hypothetical protein D3C87_1747420 [compost metagenome]
MATPTQAMTRPAFCGPTRPTPQLNAPVTIRLSAHPISARPANSAVSAPCGRADKMSANTYNTPAAAPSRQPITTARLAPWRSASAPA